MKEIQNGRNSTKEDKHDDQLEQMIFIQKQDKTQWDLCLEERQHDRHLSNQEQYEAQALNDS